MCDDKRDFAKYSWKKLPEIHDDTRDSTLSNAELLPHMCDNHQTINEWLGLKIPRKMSGM